MNITILTPAKNDHAAAVASATASLLAQRHHDGVVHVVEPHGELARQLVDGADLVVTLGGDGTFLRGAALAHAAAIPLLGINFGRLGYLLPLEPEDLEPLVLNGLDEGFSAEERAVLSVDLADGPVVAVNEVVVEKREAGHMLRVGTSIDGEAFVRYAADGVLVATPTGSTAYNLSAGGPVLAPELRALILTPVAPHLAVDRSVVLPPERSVGLHIDDVRGASVVIDGRARGHLIQGDFLTVSVHPRPLTVVVGPQVRIIHRLRSILSPTALDR
jgi:NAD+ kinase